MKDSNNFSFKLFQQKPNSKKITKTNSTKVQRSYLELDIDQWLEVEKKKEPFENKGILYHQKARECKNSEKAKKLYLKSIENWEKVAEITNEPFYYNHLLSICWQAKLIEKAEEYLRLWLEKYPKDADVHSHLASLYEIKGDNEKSKSELQIAISLKPENVYNHQRLAKLYFREGNIEKGIQVYKNIIEHFSEDVDTGIHCGTYDLYIKMCLENNKIAEILKLIDEIFKKLDEFITGKSKPKIYTEQNGEWYIYIKRKFASNLCKILLCKSTQLLKENEIQLTENLISTINNLLTNIDNKTLYLESYLLEAALFRKLRKFDKSWEMYNKVLFFCQQNKDLSKVYCEMGELLIEEGRVQQALSNFLYAIAITPDFPPANRGIKKILKLKNIDKHYDYLVEKTKNCRDFKELQKKTKEFFEFITKSNESNR